MTPTTSLFTPVEADLQILADNLKQLVGNRHPILYAAAEHLFGAGGKHLRPAIVLLVSRATITEDITARHRRLAEITEMIHTASLVHDDVVDESDVRRGVPTVHSLFGNRIAVLAGDFLFAQSSWYLANLNNLDVVKLLSEVIMDLATGEIQQGLNRFNTDLSTETYLQKSYYKTASLIANSSKAAGLISETSRETAEHLYNYGRHLGLSFQIVDDILDFTSSTDTLGKPAGSDLKSGNLTAPALYALEEKPDLKVLIEREFAQEGDLEKASALIHDSRGIQRSRELAAHHAKLAAEHISILEPSESRQALINLTDYSISRLC
ncbi:solanesyl diphosphate synthase [Aphanizomenon flos-aquae NRERC-008]|jgi:all-trans-nonaprenyl-diphosphate synthase|uniref:Solanesyl diphosphate synthase n=2 Tax=Aphanizomenon flos-aquae TaxID=1176 RepID=A0ABR8ISD9_APHFL|nr:MULTISPECIES: solanesyl diphosphate synthase [Aphanizomenon]MBD1218040.1 solanesyl diphosphate synthase [Aphanizomenon flos-aquae Clear-A1]MBO1043781.1 solanesyl diphosphate synthase [Aphanizomenon flos-aquae UKL13-PB]MCE2905657.1 solanesyl diphosphate synthase [Anabaena sp. CoA2_C59]MDJ0506287.1 solanesyl diphosphate synthase [Nostocales cyanobacterium LE14-WE12]OBQ26035.1 MAG: prenyltransferase [Aphanizomenon flos-aquae LD13]QSV67552.1 MAG: solanesyl diphosphate synthase [Aphanizomenon f